ncbi:MAG: putative acyl-CoA thioesterase [Gemmatimonadetes bacterium]|nr:putative acyl-CoA thioesterase [Gemmatimonadota bacterium]
MKFPKEAAALVLAAVMACSGEMKSPAGDSTRETRVAQVSAATGPRRTVLFLGTSLTAGLGLDPDSAYPQQIQHKIDARGLAYQTVNSGVSGETSAGLLRRLDWVLQDSAAVIVVETGANDGLRGQDIEATRATIGQILARIRKERPEAKIVLAQMEAPTNFGAEYTRGFHAMFPELAMQYGVTLMPFLLDGVAGLPSLNQGDGVHPNLEGERKVTENVWRALEPVLAPKP